MVRAFFLWILISGSIVLLITSFSSCGPDEAHCGGNASSLKPENVVNMETIYKGSFENQTLFKKEAIEITPYTYNDSINFSFKGDAVLQELSSKPIGEFNKCALQEILDKVSDRPTLEWVNVEGNLIAAAIFKKRIGLDAQLSRIENDEDAVWGWHSNLGTGGVIGNKFVVQYEEGRLAANGKIEGDQQALPLESGSIYYWCVWMWDQNGIQIVRSSRPIPFIVYGTGKIPTIEVESLEQINGRWTLAAATRNNADVTNDFPVQVLDITVHNCDAFIELTDHQGASTVHENSVQFNYYLQIQDYEFEGLRIDCHALYGYVFTDQKKFEVKFMQQ